MKPIAVMPPLRGEYIATRSPKDKIPSHGTHEWGMAYAFDFIRVVEDSSRNIRWHDKSTIDLLLGKVKLVDTYGWSEPIYSPLNGVVREISDGMPEPHNLSPIKSFFRYLWNECFFSYMHGDIQTLAGNYLIIEGQKCCAFIAHLKMGSIRPRINDTISAGQIIAEVGHSGNSSAPHLHFQLMDRADLKFAKGIACCFTGYDYRDGDIWEPVRDGIPCGKKIIRFS